MLGQQTTEEDAVAVAESMKRSASSSQPGAAPAPVWGVYGDGGDAYAAAEPSGTQRPVVIHMG